MAQIIENKRIPKIPGRFWDLRMPPQVECDLSCEKVWDAIVLGGSRRRAGMPTFRESLAVENARLAAA